MCQVLFIGILCIIMSGGLGKTLALDGFINTMKEFVDNFDCNGRTYGYYADPENQCKVFHICYPSLQLDGTSKMYKWSFICPQFTVFNQETLTCTRIEDAVPCDDVHSFYFVNEALGHENEPFSKNEI